MTSADSASVAPGSLAATGGGPPAGGAPPPPRLPRRARILLPILLIALVVFSVHRYRIESERALTEVSGRALGTTWTVKLAGGLDLPAQAIDMGIHGVLIPGMAVTPDTVQ